MSIPPAPDPSPVAMAHARGRVWLAAGAVIAAAIVAVPFVAAADDGEPTTTRQVDTTDTTTTTTAPTTTTTPTTPTTTTTTTTPTTTTPTTTTTTPTTTTPTTTTPTTTTPNTTTAPATSTTTTTTTVIPNPATTSPTTPPTTSTTAPPTTTTTAPAPPPEPAPRNITAYPEQIQQILATIRYLESRGLYTAPPNKGNASGAYQFIASTWNNYGGYPHAYLAPPHIQDERAALDVNRFLAQFDNDVSMVPVMWYYPIAARQPELMDRVPKPEYGNRLTIREYQTRWLSIFASISGEPLPPLLTGEQVGQRTGMPPVIPDQTGEIPTIAYPVLGPSRAAVPECDDAEAIDTPVDADDAVDADGTDDRPSRADIEAAGLCTEQAPGIVFGVKLQPIMAVADGIVTNVVDEPGTDIPITVTITSEGGMSYIYAGFNDDNPETDDGDAPDHLRLSSLVEVGNEVRAGQVIGFMGDTDPLPVGVRADVPTDATVVIDRAAVAPHIRLTMVDLDGTPVDAFGPVIDALFRQTCSVTIGQWSIPANGDDHEPVTIETTDDDDEIDSEWIITSTGQVTATGWAAMVNPNAGCGYAPATPHGPGADGSDEGLAHWLTPLELPTEVWVSLALQDDVTSPGGLLRPG